MSTLGEINTLAIDIQTRVHSLRENAEFLLRFGPGPDGENVGDLRTEVTAVTEQLAQLSNLVSVLELGQPVIDFEQHEG